MALPLEVRVPIDDAVRESIEAAARGQQTLEDVIRWGLLHKPPLLIADVIGQDEYSLDVVVPYRGGVYLVYDTT